MKVCKNIEFSTEKIFQVLLNSLYDDIKSVNNDIIFDNVVEGFSYKKQLKPQVGKEVEVVVNVVKLVKPTDYKVEFVSSRGTNSISYKLEKIQDELTSVELFEDFEPVSTSDKINYKVMSFILSKKLKKRGLSQIAQIEQILQSKTEG